MAPVGIPVTGSERGEGADPRSRCFLLLLAAALAVQMSYGVTLPLLPDIIQAVQPSGAGAAARHSGWLTAAYTLALFFFSPVWGAVSDRLDRRLVIAIGLAGAGAALWAMEHARSLPALYAVRIGAGVLAAAVLPPVLAYAIETAVPAHRQRRFAWIASATALGFLLGPVAGSAAAALAGALSAPQIVALSCLAVAALTVFLPESRAGAPSGEQPGKARPHADAVRWTSHALVLTALVVFGITVAEVGLTLLGGPVAPYFALCSVVMVGVQLGGYRPLERWLGERTLVSASLALMGVGVILLASRAVWAPGVSFVMAAGALGILIPALAVRISSAAGERQGRAMGGQAAAANLGQAAGAAATGVLFFAWAAAPFLLAGALLLLGALLARAGPAPRPLVPDPESAP